MKRRSTNTVRVIPHSSVPTPKKSGLIRESKLWQETVALLAAGKESMEINVGSFDGITSPLLSFAATLRRHVTKNNMNYRIFTRDGIIYVTKRKVESG